MLERRSEKLLYQLKKRTPNIISLTRIALSCVLFFFDIHSVEYILAIILIGLSDFLDGYIARKFQVCSELGAKLDSFADLIFFISITIVLTVKQSELIFQVKYLVIAIIIIKALSAIYSKIKFNKFYSIHTIANKIAGFLIFICLLAASFELQKTIIYCSVCFAILASIEELIIIAFDKEIDLNRKTIFLKKKYFINK